MATDTEAPAIIVEGVSKVFKLPHERQTSIKSLLINLGAGRKKFERQVALDNVSFKVKKGEFFGIVGRNGSGKSTLLKLLAGIYTPNAGAIHINGRLTPFIELGVGFNPELTGRENVFLNGALLGFNHQEMAAMYNDIVEFAELARFMDQKLKNYSSGMQVRLAFSIAIRAQSDILLVDEVLAVGDAAFQAKCFDHFMLLKRNKQTVVLVTHDMNAVRQYCDKAIMIEKGRIVKQGNPETVAQAYQKLFTAELEAEESKADTGKGGNGTKRWGTGKLRALKPMVKLSKETLTVTVRYHAHADLPPPVLGFSIYGPTGSNILEGNTLRQKHKTQSVRTGDELEIVWRVPNIFASGSYEIGVACCDQSGVEYYDWLNGAARFKVIKEGATAGVVDPILTIEKLRRAG